MGNVDEAQDADEHEGGWSIEAGACFSVPAATITSRGELTGLDLINHPELAADPADSLVIAREFGAWTRSMTPPTVVTWSARGGHERRIRYARDATGKLIQPFGVAEGASLHTPLTAHF